MKTIAILALALLATACGDSGYPGPSDVTVVGNGQETCTKAEPCAGTKPPVDKDPR